MNGYDAIARILQQEGVEVLFSYPNHQLINAAAAIGIRPIIARSEKTLINMADGYSRATNGKRLGVVVVQAGPGIENAFGGIAQAHADGIPLLLLPGGPNQRRQGAGEFDPIPNYHHVTKWAARINFPERIPELLRRAFTKLRAGQPGPVLLEIPGDVGGATVEEDAMRYSPPRGARSAADPAGVTEAVRLLLAAERPLIYAGHGVLWAEAWDDLRAFAELAGVPVMTTMAGKSAFPEDHPLALGAGGHTLARAAGHFLVTGDLVLGVGTSFTKGGFSPPVPDGKTMIQISNGDRDIDKDYAIDLALIGDAKLVLRQLIDEVKRQAGPGGRPASAMLLDRIKSERAAEFEEWGPRLTSDETPINPYRVIRDLMNTVDRANTIITHDSGNPRDQTLTFFETVAPRGYLGWGKSTQLGTGLGLAMGAKLAFPDKLCINIMGDLAFGTAGMEVETAVRERLPILTVLLNNSVMGGYGHHMPIASERFGANQLTGRYSVVAEGLGAYAERVENPADVVAAIQRAIAATQKGQPALLEFITKEEPVYPSSASVLKQLDLVAGRYS
jgi:acetolactate synthase-1/2/3 large subunit